HSLIKAFGKLRIFLLGKNVMHMVGHVFYPCTELVADFVAGFVAGFIAIHILHNGDPHLKSWPKDGTTTFRARMETGQYDLRMFTDDINTPILWPENYRDHCLNLWRSDLL
ncbi:MAG: hypothetical protein WB392_02010, partial [Methanotrichaceae archaeon]